MRPVVSVIVPVLDSARTLGECLDALALQRVAGPVEVLVVDNGSTDGSRELAAAHPAVDRVLDEPRRGSYAARNAGVAAASAPVLAFTDADCVPEPGWLAAALAVLGREADPADLVGGAIVPIASTSPSVWERYDRATYLDQAALVEQGFAATANLLLRRAVLDAVGPFDASLRSSGDLELGLRATDAGFSLRYAPDARVGHRPRATARQTWRLHRRLGAGWRDLADRGLRPSAGRDEAMREPLGRIIDLLAADGQPLRRRQVAHVHALAQAARWVGWLTRR